MKIFLLQLWILMLGIATGLPAYAAAAPPPLVVILLPGTSLGDWQSASAPNLHRLMQSGSVAVMNTRSAHRAGQQGGETPQSALLTLGAGARAAGASPAADFYPLARRLPGTNSSCGALFQRRTGRTPMPGQWVCVDWPSVALANHDMDYDLYLGSLAETLNAHGIGIQSGGGTGADWIAASSDGTTRHLGTLEAVPGRCVIWDAGADPAAADALIGTAATLVADRQGRLIVLSPYAGAASYSRDERLTPVLIWGDGIPSGLIRSSSTRRPGLVTDTDFAPSIAAYFGIGRTEFRSRPFGYAWTVAASPGSVWRIEQLSDQSVQQARGMRLLPYLAVALGIWILGGTLLIYRGISLGFLSIVPVVVLDAALFAVSVPSFWAVLAGLLVVALALTRFLGPARVVTIFTAGSVLVLVLDMVTGNVLMHRGLLGYSAIEGARYYGIGNEAMGLLLGSALVAAARLWPVRRTQQLALAGLLAVIVLLLGSAGAKAGGVLVSLAVFGAYLYRVSGRQWTARTVVALSLIAAFGMLFAALGDTFLSPSGHTHIGEAMQRIRSGGAGETLDIIQRKLAVEGRLAYHSAWAALLWIAVACTGLLWKQTPPLTRTDTALRSAGGVGVLACLLLNDAGVVAAAIFVVLLWSAAAVQRQSLPASEFSDAVRQSR